MVNVNFNEGPTPRILRTVFDVHVRKDGYILPFSEGFRVENHAREHAEKRAKAMGLPLVILDWQQDIKQTTGDGVFVCPIRQDQGQAGWPRIYA